MTLEVISTEHSAEGIKIRAEQEHDAERPLRWILTVTLPIGTAVWIGSLMEVDLMDPTGGIKIYDRRKVTT